MVVDQSLSCFIMDMNTSKLVTFNVEKPQGYSDDYNANFQQQDVRGRSSPFQSYINSGPRSVSFSVLLSLDYRRDLNKQTDDVRRIMMPYRSGGANSVLPPRVRVKIGNALYIEAIPTSFRADWEGGYKNGIYRICTWNFSFTEVENKSSFNTKEGIFNDKSIIPAGIDYTKRTLQVGDTGSIATEIEVGDMYTLYDDTKAYSTSIEANNSKSEGDMKVLGSGDYYVVETKGDAISISTTLRGESVGWIAIPT